MKTLLLFTAMLLLHTGISAQDSWTISHNGTQKIRTKAEDEAKNVITIRRSDLKKTGSLLVLFTENPKRKDWKRIIALFDPGENELLKHGGPVLKVGNSKLNALANTVKEIKIYTWALPTDPNVAATVRVRRIHLATLKIVE